MTNEEIERLRRSAAMAGPGTSVPVPVDHVEAMIRELSATRARLAEVRAEVEHLRRLVNARPGRPVRGPAGGGA